jgi:hypothetical protein
MGSDFYLDEMDALVAGKTVSMPDFGNVAVLGTYFGPASALGLVESRPESSGVPFGLTARGTTMYHVRNTALESTRLLNLLREGGDLDYDTARAAVPAFSLARIADFGREVELLRESFEEAWVPQSSLAAKRVAQAYQRMTDTRSWLDRELELEPASASELIARNYDRAVLEGAGGIELEWATFEWHRRVHFALELLLSSKAAAKLPPSARIFGITPGSEERQTIHAKLYAAHYDDRVVIAAGSANCSRAALLSSDSGNAELMAVTHLSRAEYEDLVSGIYISDGPPNLPETSPNADWDEIESPPVRVLTASFDAGLLVVRCAFAGGDTPSEIKVVVNTGFLIAVADEGGSFFVTVSDPGSRLWVEIDTAAGAIRSAPMWIDHEAELRVGRPEFNVQARLAGNEGPISSEGLIDIFTLVVEHYKSSVPWAGTRDGKDASSPVEYNLDDVFSAGFGRRSYAPVPGGGYLTADEWSLMNDYFRLGESTRRTGDLSDDSTDDGDPAKPKEPPVRTRPLEPTQIQKLARLMDRAVSSMSSMAFLESRPPPRLAADIRTVALRLGIARRRERMDKARVDNASAKLFHALFVGDGSRPLLDLYIQAHPEAPALMQSSDLTAAMTLWIADLFNKPEAGAWFSFAATRLAAVHPWLALGKDDTVDSLERLSLHVARLAEALPDFWLSWVQGGAAIRALMERLTDPAQLLATVTRPRIYSGEIVWIGDQFAVAEANFDRKSNADFFLLREARRARYQGSRAVPILDVIDAVELPDVVKHTIKQILTPARGASLNREPCVSGWRTENAGRGELTKRGALLSRHKGHE